jgi:molybdate transport system substrate-binding protein
MYGFQGVATKAARVILFLGLLIGAYGCGSQRSGPESEGEARTLTIYAAASLKGGFDEIAQAFEENNPGVRVLINFAGSQQLAQQIVQGAPVDVFASADDRQMSSAVESGRIAPTAPEIFIYNRLVVILPADNPGALNRLADLARPGLRLVLADDKVPVGGYAAQFLAAASQDPAFSPDFETEVRENVVSFEENVRAVTSKIGLGEADAGVVYLSDYVAAPPQTLNAILIPDHLNPTAAYPIAPVEDSADPLLASAFVDFVLSPEGQAILADYGYLPLADK